MTILPHLYLLQYLKQQCEFLRRNPSHLQFLLCTYANPVLKDRFGARFIDETIKWFQQNEIHFMYGSRLDTEKVPSIAVTYEGGTETDQYIGDSPQLMQLPKKPVIYTTFGIKDVKQGSLVVSSAEDITSKVWRGLVVQKKDFKSQIIDILPEGQDTLLVLRNPADLSLGQTDWQAVSPVSNVNRTIGSSMDQVVIKIYLTVEGHPDTCEAISCVIRYLMKQARLFLSKNGLHESQMSHSALSMSADHDSTQVWAMDFTISGLQHDSWIMTESVPGDKLEICLTAESTNPTFEEVRVWEQE